MPRVGAIITLQPAPVVPSISVQPDKIDLGETTTVTLAVEGPAPLRIELPNEAEKLLSPKSALMWQIKPIGPPKRTPQDGGRERWEQAYRLSPFFHGDRVLLAFNSIIVNGESIAFVGQQVRVRRTIEEPKAENAVPVTGIETLPPLPPKPVNASGWPFIAGLVGIFAVVLVVVLIRKKRTAPPPLPLNVWAERELDRLEREQAMERIDSRAATDRLAAILREYVERRFGLPATRLTTSELLATTAEWPADRTIPLRDVLELCDQSKFAGTAPDPAGLLALIGAGRAWIVGCRPDPSASLHSSP
jgi:hypothetical protein